MGPWARISGAWCDANMRRIFPGWRWHGFQSEGPRKIQILKPSIVLPEKPGQVAGIEAMALQPVTILDPKP